MPPPTHTIRQSECHSIAGALVLALALAASTAASSAHAQTVESFGFGTARVGGASAPTPALGTRPLLTVLIDFDNAVFPADQSPAYFERLLFGEAGSGPNLAGAGGYFEENSFGRFRFANAGVLGPFPAVDHPGTLAFEHWTLCGTGDFQQAGTNNAVVCGGRNWTIRNGLVAAVSAGFDFRPYDTNRDFRVAPDELVVLFVFANPGSTFGWNRDSWPEQCVPVATFPQPLCVGAVGAAPFPAIDSDAASTTLLHELGHALGIPYELYGETQDANFEYSVMAGSVGAPRNLRTWHFDPFTKMKLGWVRPRILPIDVNAAACARIPAVESPGLLPDQSIVILSDPLRTREFMMLEYRRPLAANYDGDPFSFGAFGMRDPPGLGIWAVRLDSAFNLLGIAALNGRRNCGTKANPQVCRDPTNLVVPPNPQGVFGHPIGSALWRPNNGAQALFYALSDASTVPVAVQVRGADSNGTVLVVEIGRGIVEPDRRQCPDVDLIDSLLDAPAGTLSHARLTQVIADVPYEIDRWTTTRFTLEREVPLVQVDPVRVVWTVTPVLSLSEPVTVRIQDLLPAGFALEQGDLPPELAILVPAGSTAPRSAEHAVLSATGSLDGAIPNTTFIRFETSQGMPTGDAPLTLEAMFNVVDPVYPALANSPPLAPLGVQQAKVDLTPRVLQAVARLLVSSSSTGVGPATQPVGFAVGSLALTLPAGSLEAGGTQSGRPTQFSFDGVVGALRVALRLTLVASGQYDFAVEVRGDMRGLTDPNQVSVSIGGNAGTTTQTKVTDRR
jgi:M6 family metalloprotease-like protein